MKKLAATFLLTGLLAVSGFAAPATAAAPDKASSTSSKAQVNQAQTGWWPD